MVVKIKDLHKEFKNGDEVTKVLYGLNLTAKQGEMIMIMGPSGSGKTTLLNMIGGIDQPNSGLVEIAGQNIIGFKNKELNRYRRDKVGFIFQFYNLLPTLTSIENVELGIENIIKDRKEIRERAKKYLSFVGLDDKLNNFPQELSAGQQQRVAIARALAKEPIIVLADEPTGNLDEDREQQILQLMKKLQKDLRMTFFIVSHNPRLKPYMDRTLNLRYGKLEEIGKIQIEHKKIEKTVKCPNCGNETKIQGFPGDRVKIVCSKCSLEGGFTFSEDD